MWTKNNSCIEINGYSKMPLSGRGKGADGIKNAADTGFVQAVGRRAKAGVRGYA